VGQKKHGPLALWNITLVIAPAEMPPLRRECQVDRVSVEVADLAADSIHDVKLINARGVHRLGRE
jgi:hypothetical protein